jgi:ketosteroid isomerase-like protein
VGADANKELIERFYAAFGRCDGVAMTACYAPNAHFRDPAFGDLEGEEVGAMWRMLTGRASDLKIELHEREAGEDSGSAHWIARYTFSTGRPVVNDIQAKFRFADGLIVDHVDEFSFWRWSRQALGPKGMALGWTPYLRGKVGGTAKAGLDKFIAKERARA